jgi:hypothetical protein
MSRQLEHEADEGRLDSHLGDRGFSSRAKTNSTSQSGSVASTKSAPIAVALDAISETLFVAIRWSPQTRTAQAQSFVLSSDMNEAGDAGASSLKSCGDGKEVALELSEVVRGSRVERADRHSPRALG